MNEYTLAKQYLSWFLIITALLTGIMLLGLLTAGFLNTMCEHCEAKYPISSNNSPLFTSKKKVKVLRCYDYAQAQDIDLWHLTKAQKQTIAIVIAAEAAGEGAKGMHAVANTIKNRAIKGNISPYQVVIAPKQYYGLTAKNRAKLYAQVKKDADYLAENIMILPDKTNGALYFRTAKEKHFKWCKIETARIGKHIFYR